MEKALIIFIKNPELGKCKTRLAKDIGDENALKIYKALLDHTRSVSADLNCDLYLYYDRFIDNSDQWPNDRFSKRLQIDATLGERMLQALKDISASYTSSIIIGSDCPELDTKLIEQAFTALEKNDFVIGPSKDGGYYLLGMNDLYPELFEGIEWSTETVFQNTIEKVQSINKTIYELSQLNDVDTFDDLQQFPELMQIIKAS